LFAAIVVVQLLSLYDFGLRPPHFGGFYITHN